MRHGDQTRRVVGCAGQHHAQAEDDQAQLAGAEGHARDVAGQRVAVGQSFQQADAGPVHANGNQGDEQGGNEHGQRRAQRASHQRVERAEIHRRKLLVLK
ncbi:hypothetical protein D3C72_2174400 [compost metagenome]